MQNQSMITASTQNFTHDNLFLYFMLLDGVSMMRWSACKYLEAVRNVWHLQTEVVQIYESKAAEKNEEMTKQDDRIVYYIITASQLTYE